MKKLLSMLCALALAFVAAAPVAAARDHRGHHGGYYGHGYGYSGHGYRGRYYDGYRRDRREDNDAIIAGIVGFAAGAIIGSAASQPRYAPAPRGGYYAPPPPRCYDRCGDYGYQGGYYDDRYAPPPQRLCTTHERQWDPYAGRYLMIERSYPC